MRSWSYLLISLASLAHAAPPAQVEIAYELMRNGSTMAEVVDRLEHSHGNYRLTETWKGKGVFRLLGRAKRTSHGKLAGDVLQPLEFVDERTGRDTARAWFDWKAKAVTMRYKGRTRTEPLPDNSQDGLTFLLLFSFIPPPAEPMAFHVFNGRGGSEHVYQVAGRERVTVPAGQFDAVKLLRGKNGDRGEIWLATAHSHLPIRIVVIEKDGVRYEQVATRITIP